ncbi:hypothetical protein QC762_405840 [Podospora pseudocomata]|uniref:Uncharacterized protein n=1 Tax=Podospora pseudocomata TaxID=2093779 RepID=A0ABR0GGY9_9PEZI|nr:hypothetical protein QC762_405840 [Podospora pseudocomata]
MYQPVLSQEDHQALKLNPTNKQRELRALKEPPLRASDPLPFRCATGGAIIRIDDPHYQITVSHIQETQQDNLHITSAQEPLPPGLEDCSFDGMSDSDDNDEDPMESETELDPALTRASVTPGVESQPWAESPSINSVGSTVGTPTGRQARNRRLDCALIALDNNEIMHSLANTISYPQHTGIRKVMVHNVAEVGKRMNKVMAITARDGIGSTLATGALYQWDCAIKKAQKLYPINLDTPVEGGNSGSAVIDTVSGSLYGHIVRGCPGSRVAYIIAATEVFDHLRQEHGADIHLCGSPSTKLSADLTQLAVESRRLELERWQHYAKLAQTIDVKPSSSSTASDDLWSPQFMAENAEDENSLKKWPETSSTTMSGYIKGRLSPLLESNDGDSLHAWSADRATTLSSAVSRSTATTWYAALSSTRVTAVQMELIAEDRDIEMSGLFLDNPNEGNKKTPLVLPKTSTTKGDESDESKGPLEVMRNEATQNLAGKKRPVMTRVGRNMSSCFKTSSAQVWTKTHLGRIWKAVG